MHANVGWRRAMRLIAAVAMSACTGEPGPPALPEGVSTRATKLLGTLEVVLSVPGDLRRGSPVTVSVDLVNRGDTLVRLDAPGDRDFPPFDTIVVGTAGDTVWQEPPSRAPRADILRINPPIAPGETQAYGAARWNQSDSHGRPVRPGVYRVSVRVYAPAPWGDITVGPVLATIAQ